MSDVYRPNDFVLVRTVRAGVHCGLIQSVDGQRVVLSEARRIWRWQGANTLHEVALDGVAEEFTRISRPVPIIELLSSIEIIPCSSKAQENLSRSRWGR